MASFENYIADVREELAQIEAEIMAPVYEAINTALDDYGKTLGYNLILGATPSGNILFVFIYPSYICDEGQPFMIPSLSQKN